MKLGARDALPALKASVEQEVQPGVKLVLELAISQLST